MSIPEEVISDIKFRNDIETVIASYVNLKRRGKNLIGLCPFHNEKTPSFTVYPENGSFYCFGCGVGGDVFTFTKLIENLDYIEAVKLLAERSGITIPEDSGYDDSISNLKKTILEINRATAKFYHNFLMSENGKWALDYLLGRGLTLQTIKHFGLGAAPDNWSNLTDYLKGLGYSFEDMVLANVVSKSSKGSYYDRFRNRVMFPVIDLRGNVIAFSGRARPDDEKAGAKYVNTSDTYVYKKSQNLFGFNFAKNNCADRIILVEGNMDVISLHQAGFNNTVAALGTSFTEEQAKLISRYTKEIVLIFDSDSAGKKALNRALGILKNSGLNVRVTAVPDGKDPDEFIKKNSPDKFRKLIENASGSIEYKLLSAADEIDKNSDMGKLEYLKKVAEILAFSGDKMAEEYYVSKLSSDFGISKTTLFGEIDKIKAKKVREEKKKELDAYVHPKYSSADINPEKRNNKRAAFAEESVISVLLNHPDYYSKIKDSIREEDFITSFNKRLYQCLIKAIESGRNVDISAFSETFSPSELGFIVSLQSGEISELNAFSVLKDSISVIKEENNKKLLSQNTEDDEEWEKQMQKLINNKKGE